MLARMVRKGPRTMDEYSRELGHNLKRARERSGLSQERLAHTAGLASYTYQKFEKGESRPGTPANPRLATLLSLANVLGVSVTDLLPKEPPAFRAGHGPVVEGE